MGNFRDDYAARGIHDPLYSRAILIENSEGLKIALLSVDICMLHRENVAFVREYIHHRTGILPGHILVAATHTHAGPAVFQRGGRPGSPDTDIRRFLKKAASAAALAVKKMRPANLSIGYALEKRISFNRRLLCRDRRTHMNWEKLVPGFVVKPHGPVDPQVMALSVSYGCKPAAVAVNFGLHPAILAGDNWLYSADFPGYLSEALGKISGSNLCGLFFNGCCGNINHIDYTDPLQGRGYQMTQRVGYMLAAAVQEALAAPSAIKGDELSVSSEMIKATRLKISDKTRKWSEAVLKKDAERKTRGQVDGVPDVFYATIYREMHRIENEDDHLEVMVIRIGDLAVVGLPGEIFCEFGLSIKRRSPAKHTIIIELANDAAGYFPVRRAFNEGGHGATVGTTLYQPGTGERMVESAIRQLNKLFK
jgi:hypothetical protein